MIDFSVSAAVGQASTHAPQETHSDSRNGWSWLAATLDSKPRPWMVSAKVPCTSSQARTQREHTMRSEEHTSELQSLRHLVCRLLLEKKKKNFVGYPLFSGRVELFAAVFPSYIASFN